MPAATCAMAPSAALSTRTAPRSSNATCGAPGTTASRKLTLCVTGTISGAPLPPPTPAQALITVDAANVTHQVRRGMLGCHTDLGYDHQIYGFYAQRLYGESFENYTLAKAQSTESNGTVGNPPSMRAACGARKPGVLFQRPRGFTSLCSGDQYAPSRRRAATHHIAAPAPEAASQATPPLVWPRPRQQ